MTSPEHLARVGWRPGTLKPGDKVILIIHPMHDGTKGRPIRFGNRAGRTPGGHANTVARSRKMRLRKEVFAVALLLTGAVACAAAGGASGHLPDWSGQWENVGATPDASGGFNQSLEQVLKQMQWSPPLNAATKAKVDAMQAKERARLAAVARGENPAGAFTACTFGYPGIMLDTPLMFEVLATPKETALIFSSREIRHIYTDGRQHTAKMTCGRRLGAIQSAIGRDRRS